MREEIEKMLVENRRRLEVSGAFFEPVSGEGSPGVRRRVRVEGLEPSAMWLTEEMLADPFVAEMVGAGSLDAYLLKSGSRLTERSRREASERFERMRCYHDFPYWAARYAYIKKKGGGDDILFRLNPPQRRLVSILEEERVSGRPIRLIMLKARQWGGSALCYLLIYLNNAE